MYIILFIFYGINIIITSAHAFTYVFAKSKSWQTRDHDFSSKPGTWFWWLGYLRGCVLLSAWASWIWATVKMYEMKTWMMNSGWMSGANLKNDNELTFGQLMSVLLLGGAVLTVRNDWSGKSIAFLVSRH